MAGPNVGFATLSIIPSAKGFASAISGEIGAPMAKAAKDEGAKSGSGFMESFAGKAKLAALAAGAVVGAALAKGLSDAMDAEVANDKLAAQLGLSPQQAEAFGRAAGNLYRQAYGDSLGEVNSALSAVSSTLSGSLGSADDALETTTAKALDLAAAFDLDVGEAVSAAGVLVQSGLAANADEAFDLVTRGLQEMPAAIRGELLEASNEYGTFFDTLGFTGEQTFKLLTDAADSGIYGIDKTGDAIKEFTIRATDLSATSKDAYDTIGLSAEDMTNQILAGGDSARGAFSKIVDGLRSVEDPGKRAEAAIALFGTPLEDLNVSEIPAFLDSLSGMSEGLGGVEGAATAMGDTLNDNAATKIEAFKRQALGGLADFVGNTVIPSVESLVALFQEEGLGGVLGKVGEAISNAMPGVIEGLGSIAGAVGQWIIDTAPVVAEKMLELGAEFYNWVAPQIPPLLLELGGLLKEAGEWVLRDGIPLLADGIGALASAFIDWVANDAIPGLLGKDGALWSFLDDVADWIQDDAGPAFVRFGKDLGAALIDGLVEAFKDLPTPLEVFLDALGGDPTIERRVREAAEGREHGGTVRAGVPYVVGEKRPELFVPDQSGTILPFVPNGGSALVGGDLVVQQLPGEDAGEATFRALRKLSMVAG